MSNSEFGSLHSIVPTRGHACPLAACYEFVSAGTPRVAALSEFVSAPHACMPSLHRAHRDMERAPECSPVMQRSGEEQEPSATMCQSHLPEPTEKSEFSAIEFAPLGRRGRTQARLGSVCYFTRETIDCPCFICKFF